MPTETWFEELAGEDLSGVTFVRDYVQLESEARWADVFANSQGELARLAEVALAEHARGETEELDPDRL